MRLHLSSPPGTSRALLESMGLALLVGGIIFAAGRARYEAIATLAIDSPSGATSAPPTAAKRLLTGALRYAEDPPVADPTMQRVFRVDVLRNQQLQLVCETERWQLAQQLCMQAANDAVAQSQNLRIVSHTPSRVLVRRRLFDAAWPALLAGLGWILVRTSRKRSRPVEAPERSVETNRVREYGQWSVQNRTTPASPVPLAGPSTRRAAPRRPAPITRTMVGMPVVSAQAAHTADAAAVAAEFEPVELMPSRPPPVAAEREPVDSARPSARVSTGPDVAGRVIYHVSTGAWSADPNVLTDEPLEELCALRDEIYSQANGSSRVIRVTSASNSRYAKSQVAAQLACTLSERKGKRVLVVEADLDAPALHKIMRLNVPRGFGFSEQLERLANPTSERATARDVTLLRVSLGLHALVESRFGTPALFDSPQFSSVLTRLREEHDVIVIDGPVVDAWADAQALKGNADLIVFVVAAGTALGDVMKLTHAHFEDVKAVRTIKTGEWPNV